MKWKIFNQKYFIVCPLLFVVILGAFLRFYNLNWDQGYFFNPDESNNIAIPASELEFPFKPSTFTYGSLTIYLYHFAASLLSFITQNPLWLEPGHINLIGRFISATLSTLIIFLVYHLGQKVSSQTVGLLAAFFTATSVGLIQAAHFGTTETIITLAGLLTLAAIFKVLKADQYKKGYLAGTTILALAAAAKFSALVFLPPFFLSHLVALSRKNFYKRNFFFLASFLWGLLLFFSVFPYSLLAFPEVWQSFQFEAQIASGKIPIFFTTQFEQTTPYLFQITQILPQVAGWPVLISGLIGSLVLLILGFKTFSKEKLFLLLLPTFYFLYNGSLFVKWTRYMVPLLPFFSLFAAFSLLALYDKFSSKKSLRFFTLCLILLVCSWQLFYGFAFLNIYRQTDTRIAASRWIYQSLPQNSTLLLEPLDVVSLPLPGQPNDPSLYKQTWFDFYGLDSFTQEEKKQEQVKDLASQLSETDFVILGSRRLWANRLRLKENYPQTARYYRLLFEEQLGFKKIKEFSSYPLNDDSAEETFQVFDHPTVMIFKNISHLTAENLERILVYEP